MSCYLCGRPDVEGHHCPESYWRGVDAAERRARNTEDQDTHQVREPSLHARLRDGFSMLSDDQVEDDDVRD